MITRESWLRQAVTLINDRFFNGEVDIEAHPYQIACGWTKRSTALGETINPKPDAPAEYLFPTTIHIRISIDDPIDILGTLVHEFIHAFYNIHGHGKDFAKIAKRIGFNKPYTKYYPSEELVLKLKEVYNEMVIHYGEWPGLPIKPVPEEAKEKKKNTYILFCPECGYEVRITRKTFEKHNQGLPTCVCGAKMARDCEDE